MQGDPLILGQTLQMHLLALIIGSARLFAFVQVAPFMGANVVTGTIRTAIVFTLYLFVHPLVLESIPADLIPLTNAGMVTIAGLVLKEVFIGFILGYLAGMIFWTIESAGFFIDNQRGASQAAETDPLSGSQSSVTGSFLFQSITYVFYASGAFLAMLGVIYSTYEFLPAGQYVSSAFFTKEGAALFFGEKVARLALEMVLLAAPVVLACLFTDISLGLINRFASQLNVYVLAMPIKSGISSFLLILYFAVLMTDSSERFKIFSLDLMLLRNFF